MQSIVIFLEEGGAWIAHASPHDPTTCASRLAAWLARVSDDKIQVVSEGEPGELQVQSDLGEWITVYRGVLPYTDANVQLTFRELSQDDPAAVIEGAGI